MTNQPKTDEHVARQAASDIYRYYYGPQHEQSFHKNTYDFIFAKVLNAIAESKAPAQRMKNVWETGSPVHEQKEPNK